MVSVLKKLYAVYQLQAEAIAIRSVGVDLKITTKPGKEIAVFGNVKMQGRLCAGPSRGPQEPTQGLGLVDVYRALQDELEPTNTETWRQVEGREGVLVVVVIWA